MSHTHPLYHRVTVSGLLLFALGMVLSIVLGLVQGSTDNLVFLAVFLVASLIFAGVSWRYEAWTPALAAGFCLIGLALQSPLLLHAIRHPSSAYDFVPGLIALTGLSVGLAGGTIAFWQHRWGTGHRWGTAHRRGSIQGKATSTERKLFVGAAMLLAGLVLVSGTLAMARRTTVSVEARAEAIEVQLRKIRFEPDQLEIRSGEKVTLFVKNSDFTLHTFTVESLGIDEEILPRNEIVIEIPAASHGSYKIICAVPGHERMIGTLVVR